MSQVVIENPILNSPFTEPGRHFRFDDDGITDQIEDSRRISCYFIPIPRPRKKGKDQQQTFDGWTEDRIEENVTVNAIRQCIRTWRDGRYTDDLTRPSARLLDFWRRDDRARRLFFCQTEALETIIYITEVAKKYGHTWIENDIRGFNDDANPGLLRIASKMATGSGKTVVMAMFIAWQTLNKIANPRDTRFTDSFLIVTPGITIRDRLRVLLPSDPGNYYRAMEIVPSDLMDQIGQAKIVITNFHAFKQREKVKAGKLTKEILNNNDLGEASAFTETEGEMVRRVCRGLGTKKNIIVINDEAHHCYRRRVGDEGEKLTGDERKEAETRNKDARIWISGLEAVQRRVGVKMVYDLSATPFFLRGSGYSEGTLFPWVVSDFSLIDAIECGIVKVPRVPVADNTMEGEQPTYRDLWLRIRDDLPKKGRKTQAISGEPNLPVVLEGALQSLYANYAKSYQRWLDNDEAQANGLTPPVFIVVCNNTNVSKMVYDHISGWDKELPDGGTVAVPGKLPIFSNVEQGPTGNRFSDRPNTILVDSEQLESGEAMSKDFKQIAAREIDEFKHEYRRRFPDRDPDKLTDEDLLREVLNTVGKPGKLGENVKCVVSVSMLTEGWDANTVTHILGVRAFGTQLLCEQVVGRGLRRMSYSAEPQECKVNGRTIEFDAFPVEYAEVYGVPFSFIPSAGSSDPKPGPTPTRVRALEERIECEITFPRIDGYRYELPAERLKHVFTDDSKFALTTASIPTKVENAPIVGESSIHTLDDLKKHRKQEVAFMVARRVLEHYFRDSDQNVKPWLFPDLLEITRRWLEECLILKDNTFPQLLLLVENAHDAADRIYKAIVDGDPEAKRLLPISKPYDTIGSTRYVDFDTTRPVYRTDPKKCQISHVVADTESWEQKMAEALEDMDEVLCYAKNHNLHFLIPYTVNGDNKNYMPDFIVRLDDGHGRDDPLNLIVEVSGQKDGKQGRLKQAKVTTARTLWVPAVNNAGTWGRWAFIEITDPWDAQNTIRTSLGSSPAPGVGA